MLRRWQFWVGLLISASFLYFALRGLKLAEVWDTIRQARYGWLAPAIAVYFVAVWARSWRWHYMLRPLKKVSTNSMFPIVSIGYMGNNIYPARAGEVLRAMILKQREGVPVSATLATIIVERIFDGVVMLGFFFINLPDLARLTHDSGLVGNLDIRTLALFGSLFFLGALFVFLLAAMFPRVTERLLERVLPLLPQRFREKVRSLVLRFLSGLQALRSPVDGLMIFLITVLVWLLETTKYWLVMQAFDFNVSFFGLMLMNGIVNLATSLPSAPGYIGTFDGLGIAVLVAYGVPGEIAAGYVLMLHGALWFPITVLGAYYYLRQPLRMGKQIQSLQGEAKL